MILGSHVPRILPAGMRYVDTPALATPRKVKCDRCGCTVKRDHVPDSTDCQEARDERHRSQNEW